MTGAGRVKILLRANQPLQAGKLLRQGGSDPDAAETLPRRGVFSAADRPVLLLSFSLGADRSYALGDGVRNRQLAASVARTIRQVTPISANWKVMARA